MPVSITWTMTPVPDAAVVVRAVKRWQTLIDPIQAPAPGNLRDLNEAILLDVFHARIARQSHRRRARQPHGKPPQRATKDVRAAAALNRFGLERHRVGVLIVREHHEVSIGHRSSDATHLSFVRPLPPRRRARDQQRRAYEQRFDRSVLHIDSRALVKWFAEG